MSETTLRAVLDALPMAICAFDADNRLTFVNSRSFEISGIDPSVTPIGASLREVLRVMAYGGFYGAGDPEEHLAAALAVDRSRPFRRITQGPLGRWFEIVSLPLPNGGFMGCAREVTLEKRSETEARDRASRLESLLAALSGGVALYDRSQRLVLHNPALEGLIGATAAMLADQPTLPGLMQRLADSDEFSNEVDAAGLAATLAGARLERRQAVQHRPSGAVIRYTSAPMPGGGFLVEANDITALKHAEDEARGRAAMLQAVVSALPHGICVYGPDRRLTMANEAYAHIMDGAPIAIGDHLDDIVRRRAEAGEFGPGDPAEIARVQLAFSPTRSRASQRLRPNGTAIDIRTAPLPDGGHLSVVTDITALYRAEEEARRRSTILETMLETMRHGIALFGPDHRLVAANALAERMAGHETGALQPGRLFDDLMHDLHARGVFGEGPEAETLFRDLMALDRSQPNRHIRRGPDGRMLEIVSDPTPDGGFVVTQVDITPLAFAEEEAQRRADLLQSILDNMRFGVVLFDADRRLIAINALASTLSGLPPGTYRIGRTIEEIMSEAVRGGHFDPQHAERIIRSDRSVPHSYRRRRSDGVVLEISSDPNPDGGFVVVLSDVTKLATAEAEIERRAQLLQSMLDNIRHGVCLFDGEGQVVAANAMAARLSGVTPEQMAPGTPIETLRRQQAENGEYGPPEEAQRMLQDRAAKVWSMPQRYVRRRGNGDMLEVTTDAAPGGGFIRTYSDVTADYAIRAELETARAAAEAASLAKSRFLATMSHELRTPLNAIIGFSEMLAQDATPAADARGFGRAIHEAGEQLRALIDGILDVARAETGQFTLASARVAPGIIAAEAARMTQGAIDEAGLTLSVEIAAALPDVMADAERLRQVLFNLLSNAAKFTPSGGKVSLAVSAEAGSVYFQVEDTGIGMPDADVPRAFEPFTQLDDRLARRYAGSGIGLHLARVLAEAHGGVLTLESRPGQGTMARLSLPGVGPDPQAKPTLKPGSTP